jgi:hypothetical protein
MLYSHIGSNPLEIKKLTHLLTNIDTIFWIQEVNKIMFYIYLIMKVGNFIYNNIKELVAIRLISFRNEDT